MKKLFLTAALVLSGLAVSANDYDEAWKALGRNDRHAAKDLLQKAMKDPATALDAYLTYIFVMNFESKAGNITDYADRLYASGKSPYPYIYSMWFNDAVLGEYGKKEKAHQLKLLEKILADPACNGSLKSAAHYVKSHHLLFSNKMQQAPAEWKQMGALTAWQFTGPFDNLSASGYDKDFAPISQPQANSVFKSVNNADVKWFSPGVLMEEGWTPVTYNFIENTAVVFAQCFVNAPEDMKVLLCSGGTGTIKIWVNDQLVTAAPHDRVTELDCYKNYCNLKKGYNRILVQLGYHRVNNPNFIVRLTDDNYNAVKGLSCTAEYQPYTPVKGSSSAMPSLPHFAEKFFEEKIKESPDNLINYILLSKAYTRNNKAFESRKILEAAMAKAGDNSIIRLELITCLSLSNNRTSLLEQAELIKDKDPKCQFSTILFISQNITDKKFEEAQRDIDYYIETFGRDEETYSYQIQLAGAKNNSEDIIRLIKEAYLVYPGHVPFLRGIFTLYKESYKDSKGAIKVYENFLKKEYQGTITNQLAKEYFELGMIDKGLKVLLRQHQNFPYDPETSTNLAIHYYGVQQYKEALVYCQKALACSPYTSTYWSNLGAVYEGLGDKEQAIASYRKSIYYSPNQFTSHEKLRLLENKPDLRKAFPEYDPYTIIKAAQSSYPEHGYYYIIDDENSIVYPEGTNEKYSTLAVKILNHDGIDRWKTVSIPYNPNTQELIIEKSEVIKKNGNKISAETDDNQLVFTNLEVGDAILLKYKVRNYAYGRLAREFWDKFNFDQFAPNEHSRYCLLIANNIPFNHKVINGTIQPEITDYDRDFKLYTWEKKGIPGIKSESYMPPLSDVGTTLHISSLKSWQDIARWYSDLCSKKNEEDFEVKEVYDQLFPAGKAFTEEEKARKIRGYIADNISYSSVSFRQSAYVPQDVATTIVTHLGDCKDVSSLFVTLARMAGLKANLVLIDTRNNGTKDMVLPSFEFNHCIAQVTLGNKPYYLELTDKNLPFASLPKDLYGALSLYIPYRTETSSDSLRGLYSANRNPDKVRRVINIKIEGSNLEVSENGCKSGNSYSSLRSQYLNLSGDQRKEDLEKSVNSRYKKNVTLHEVSFKNIETLSDSMEYSYRYTVKDALIDMGEFRSLQVIYPDAVATMDGFTSDKRNFDIDYWDFENTDVYETEVNITAPEGKTITQVPAGQTYKFGNSVYTISFAQKSPGQLKIMRKAVLDRGNVKKEDYAAMKTFLDNILKIEGKYFIIK